MTLLTKKQYALHRGCTAAFISKKKIKALLAPATEIDQEDGKPKINMEQADAILNASLGMPRRRPAAAPAQAQKISGGDPVDDYGLLAMRVDRLQMKNEQERLSLIERKKNLLWKDDVQAEFEKSCALLARHLSVFADRAASRAARMSDTRELKWMFEDELRQTMNAIIAAHWETIQAAT